MGSSRPSNRLVAAAVATLLSGTVWSAPELTPGVAPHDRNREMIAALSAPGPHPSLGDEARLFDRLVGTWDCQYSFHAEDGTVRRRSGELSFGWILDGRAIQDIWISYPTAGSKEERHIGTSIRFFDVKTKLWRVVFVAPAMGYVVTVKGGAEEIGSC